MVAVSDENPVNIGRFVVQGDLFERHFWGRSPIYGKTGNGGKIRFVRKGDADGGPPFAEDAPRTGDALFHGGYELCQWNVLARKYAGICGRGIAIVTFQMGVFDKFCHLAGHCLLFLLGSIIA